MSNPQFQSNVFATIYNEAIQLTFESEKQGRPIFQDVPFIRIAIPGDLNNIIERKLTESDKTKYSKAWEAYQRGEATGFTGTPLEQWPQISRAQVKEAKYFECHTVEQLAELSDSNFQKMGMGFRELREKAKAYLNLISGNAQSNEVSRMGAEMEALKKQLAELAPKRGRPAKIEEETT